MALIVVVAGKGAPGSTVTSLALTLAAPRGLLLVEGDPSGGTIHPGYLAGQLPNDRGMAQLAVADRRQRLFEEFGTALIDLGADPAGRSRWLLPGVADPAQAASLGGLWDRLGAYFASFEKAAAPYDVIVDCGRIPAAHAPVALLRHAAAVLLVMGRSLSDVVTARSRIAMLNQELATAGSGVLRLVIRQVGDYPTRDVERQLQVPVLFELPEDQRTAAILSTGSATPNLRAPLLRAAATAHQHLQQLVQQRHHPIPPTPATAIEATHVR